VTPAADTDDPAAMAASDPARARRELAADVRRDLRRDPKQLPAKHLYDALGLHLFEAICHLPWYKITRAEHALLARFAPAISASLRELAVIVELGCGSGTKLALLAEGLRGRDVTVRLVDVSATAIELTQRTLARLPNLAVVGHQESYGPGLRAAIAERPGRGSLLVLFLGSNIGNFHHADAEAFLRDIRRALHAGDALLLGADLVKPERELLLAYDDPLGLTAAFDKNVLRRVNDELGADFDLAAFEHRAVWNAAASRIEMHLVSRCAQEVRVPAAEIVVRFRAGESIWTESSYKYTPEGLVTMAGAAGFHCLEQWIEPDARCALMLFAVR